MIISILALEAKKAGVPVEKPSKWRKKIGPGQFEVKYICLPLTVTDPTRNVKVVSFLWSRSECDAVLYAIHSTRNY